MILANRGELPLSAYTLFRAQNFPHRLHRCSKIGVHNGIQLLYQNVQLKFSNTLELDSNHHNSQNKKNMQIRQKRFTICLMQSFWLYLEHSFNKSGEKTDITRSQFTAHLNAEDCAGDVDELSRHAITENTRRWHWIVSLNRRDFFGNINTTFMHLTTQPNLRF